MSFDDAFDALMVNEGGYVFDPLDPGGETMYGVTAAVARENGYTGPMKELPRDTAKQIAKAKYWDPCRCDDLPESIRFDVFDMAYNSGVTEAIETVQKACGTIVDGDIGPVTIEAAKSLNSAVINAERIMFYTQLAGWEHDGKGWARRIATNLKRSS